MADLVFMYALTAGVFAVFTAILFGSRAKRRSNDTKVDSRASAPV